MSFKETKGFAPRRDAAMTIVADPGVGVVDVELDLIDGVSDPRGGGGNC
jgi:hypothetical protein